MKNLYFYVQECKRELDSLGIQYGNVVEIKINSRAKKRLGLCTLTPAGYVIEISNILLADSVDVKTLKETIIHEILHTCDGCLNHGKKWKALADKVNAEFNYSISRCANAAAIGIKIEPPTIKYLLFCEQCNTVFFRSKMTKVVQHPENYVCRCGGEIKRIL